MNSLKYSDMTRVQSEKLLLVDDDISIREAVSDYLRAHGYDVTSVPNVLNLEARLREEQWDLVILDLMMPGEDGLSACRRLSDKCPPILILSAMADVIDRVAGLEAGACDYLPKPFEPRELLARIRALLRLTKKKPCNNRIATSSTNNQDGTYSFLGWRLLAADRVLYDPSGQEVSLTYNEMSLLIVLASRPGRLLNRDMLMNLTRGNEADTFDRSIDLAISRLRGKLGKDGGELIETIRGAGYRFRPKGAKY